MSFFAQLVPNLQMCSLHPLTMCNMPGIASLAFERLLSNQLSNQWNASVIPVCRRTVWCPFPLQILSRPITVQQLGATIKEPQYLENEFRVSIAHQWSTYVHMYLRTE